MLPLGRTLIGLVVSAMLGLRGRLLPHGPRQTRRGTRRAFVRNATLGAVLVVLAETGIGLYKFVYPNKTGAFGKKLPVAKTNVPPVEGTPFTVTQGKFYVVHTPDGVLANYWRCVHLGCTVPWKPAEHRFHCPCHGSIYAYDGQRIAGPAPRSMDYFPVTVKPNGDLVVDTGTIKQRALYHPSQAVPYSPT